MDRMRRRAVTKLLKVETKVRTLVTALLSLGESSFVTSSTLRPRTWQMIARANATTADTAIYTWH